MSNDIGRKLKQLRKERKLTQGDVAERVKMTRSTISNYELGRRTPNLKHLQTLAAFYSVNLNYFNISPADEAVDLLARAKTVFESDTVPHAIKENLYRDFMRAVFNAFVDKVTVNEKTVNVAINAAFSYYDNVGDNRQLSGVLHRLAPIKLNAHYTRKNLFARCRT